jgi:hypothetical protein
MSATDDPGGLGGTCGRGARDTRLVERALRERWPIPKAIRGPLIDRLAGIVNDPGASPREATAAARAILTASKINVDLIGATIKAREHEELAARVAALEARSGEWGSPRHA